MNNLVIELLTDKFEKSEKLILFGINDLVSRALEEARNVKRIAIQDVNDIFWVISSWKLSLLNPNISFKQAYAEKKEIFERAGVATIEGLSNSEKIYEIITDLYEFSGLTVFKKEKVIGFVSLINFSESEMEIIESFKRSFVPKEQIKQRAKIIGGLAGADLHGLNLEEIDLRNGDLRGADFSMAILRKANLRGANLTGANLSGADLTDANLARAKLDGANLKDAILINADLSFAQLWDANLENAKIQGANLRDSVLFRANLKSAILENTNLFNAGLMRARLEGTDLSNVDIRNANLKDATFDEKTKLSGIEINSITLDNLTESALKAEWDPEIKQYLKKKYD